MSRLSAIVSTYNRPGHLRAAVASLEHQTRPPDEIVIADDGSAPEHVAAIAAMIEASPLPIVHAWQPDLGFRVAAARNTAARRARGDLLFFTDGDAVLAPDVLAHHRTRVRPGVSATGFHVMLTEEETRRVSVDTIAAGRFAELLPPPDDPRVERLPRRHRSFVRRARIARLLPIESRQRRVKLHGLQFTVARADFERVNGFDEAFVGWGLEDHDLALRLQIAGVAPRSVIDRSIVVHQWHARAPRIYDAAREARVSRNRAYLERRRHGEYRCEEGLAEASGAEASDIGEAVAS